jgi:hypothetical protein
MGHSNDQQQSDETPERDGDDDEPSHMLRGLPIALPISFAFGLLLFDNLALGLAFWPALALIIGAVMARKSDDNSGEPSNP